MLEIEFILAVSDAISHMCVMKPNKNSGLQAFIYSGY